MGLLQDGKWVDQWYDTESSGGHFVRKAPQFRSWVTVDGTAGPSGDGGFKAESGRYHLYVSLACPWAHRTLIFRALKELEQMISVSVVHWYMAEDGWTFAAGDGVLPDTVNDAQLMHEVYTKAISDYSGRVTVPVLWDKQTKPSSPMNRLKLSGCLIQLLTGSAPKQGIIIRQICAARPTPSTSGSMRRLTTVYISVGLPPLRRLIKKPSPRFLTLWTGWKTGFAQSGI